MLFSPDDALARLPLPATAAWPDGVRDVEVLRHRDLLLEMFAPRGVDRQSPHDRDEVYVVVRGSAVLVTAAGRHPCGPGDALFVPAYDEHHFEQISDDFASWVVFAGPPA